jgi:hypothetical protein
MVSIQLQWSISIGRTSLNWALVADFSDNQKLQRIRLSFFDFPPLFE